MKKITKKSSLLDELRPKKKSGLPEQKKIDIIKPAFPKKQSTAFPSPNSKPFKAADNGLNRFLGKVNSIDQRTKIDKARDKAAKFRPPGMS